MIRYFFLIDGNNRVVCGAQTIDDSSIPDGYIEGDETVWGDQWNAFYDGTTWSVVNRDIPLDDAKQAKITELQIARDNEIYSSFTSTALDGVSPKTYNYDREAADNFRAETALLGLDMTITSVYWYVIDDAAFVTHTRDQFIQVIKDGAAHDKSQKMKYFGLEAQVKAATDTASVNAIVW